MPEELIIRLFLQYSGAGKRRYFITAECLQVLTYDVTAGEGSEKEAGYHLACLKP